VGRVIVPMIGRAALAVVVVLAHATFRILALTAHSWMILMNYRGMMNLLWMRTMTIATLVVKEAN